MVLVKQRTLSFGERIYLKTVVAGLVYTFRNLFKRKVTRLYPEEKLKATPATAGIPVLVQEPAGHPRCVACGLCEFICPPRAITIVGRETERAIEREPESFEIDFLRCIECGYCEEVCPEEAIVLSQDVELTGSSRDDFKWNLDRLLVPAERLKTRLEYVRRNFDRFHGDPRAEATASFVPGKDGAARESTATAVHAAARRYRDNY